MRIGLFITCLGDTLFPESGRATVALLERLGHEVVFPAEQTCCGQMHANSGFADQAFPLIRRFERVFGGEELDAIVAPSGSCVAMVRDHYSRLAREAGDARLEQAVTALRGRVFELTELLWAADAETATRIVGELVAATGAEEVVKVKSITTDEIGLNDALAERGITAIETDLAELINQLAGDISSHILVPAIHRNRTEIRDVFNERLPRAGTLDDSPENLAEASRRYLRSKFMSARVAVSGANFAIAETGTVGVVESEGNGRMCTTLPETLITVMGIEKVLPRVADLEVMLQLLPRSSTAERMNPYTSLWTGVTPGDGPREFHLVLLDAGRTSVLADQVGHQALHCIRCSACLNVCPVYERTGGHAYESVYPGPIGAILTPQLSEFGRGTTLPWASSLCGACYEVCPVRIDIPTVLVHLRTKITRAQRNKTGANMPRLEETAEERAERVSMAAIARLFRRPRRYHAAQRLGLPPGRLLARFPRLARRMPGPLARWTVARELPEPPKETFGAWWAHHR